MKSIKNNIVDFLMNRVLANAPAWLLIKLYEYRLAKAKPKIDALKKWWDEFSKEEFMLCSNAHQSFKTNRPVVVPMVGLPQSGKTTISQELSRYGFFHVNTNDIRAQLNNLGLSYEHDQTIALYYAVQAILLGCNVVIDSDHMLPIKRAVTKAALSQIEVRGIPVFKVVHVGIRSYNDWLERVREKVRHGKVSNELYHNAIRRRYPSLESDDPGRFKEEVIACINEEYKRQMDGHLKYVHHLKADMNLFGEWSVEEVSLWVGHAVREIVAEVNSK